MSDDEIRVIGACPSCGNYPDDCHCKDWITENMRLRAEVDRGIEGMHDLCAARDIARAENVKLREQIASLESQLAAARAEREQVEREAADAKNAFRSAWTRAEKAEREIGEVIDALDCAEDVRHGRPLPDAARGAVEAFQSTCDMMLKAESDRDTARSQLATADASAAAMRETLHTLATEELPGRYEEAAKWVRDTALKGVAVGAAKALLSRLEKAEAVVKVGHELSDEFLRVDAGEVTTENEFAYDNAWERFREALAATAKEHP